MTYEESSRGFDVVLQLSAHCYGKWKEIASLEISCKNRYYTLNDDFLNHKEIIPIFYKLSHKKWANPRIQIAHSLQLTDI